MYRPVLLASLLRPVKRSTIKTLRRFAAPKVHKDAPVIFRRVVAASCGVADYTTIDLHYTTFTAIEVAH
jgi:hypothetical protein